jgi:FkbM family methyltransferase
MRDHITFAWGRLGVTWRAASALRERLRFVAREMVGRRYTRTYTLRNGSLKAIVRHPFVDVGLVHDILSGGEYTIPEAVRRQLHTLGRPVRVLDLGGNIGLFALHVQRELRCRVTSVEPDPRNAAVLRRCIATNAHLDWRLVEAAAGTTDGQAEFISDFAHAQIESVADEFGGHITQAQWLPPKLRAGYPKPLATTVPVIDVMPYLVDCDLLKIDVEGAEWALLADPRFRETGRPRS